MTMAGLAEPRRAGLPDRRAAKRWTVQELPWPVACRIIPGRDALIVDLSAVGMLIESDEPLPPGRMVVVHLIRPSRRVSLAGTVVRSFVSTLDRPAGPSFRAALSFARWFEPLRELDSRFGPE
jgi:PilZ domain